MDRPIFARCACWSLAALLTLPIGVAHAQTNELPLRVEYANVPGCPTSDVFFAEVKGRTARVLRTSDAAGASLLVVALAKGNEESYGHLLIRGPDGDEAERDVTGDTCDEVVSALALVAALALEPGAKSASPASTSGSDAARTPAPSPSPSPSPPLVAMSAPPSPVSTPPDATSSVGERRADPRRWHFAMSFGGAVSTGVSPGALFGVPIALEAVAPSRGALAPSVHVGFERATSGTTGVNGATANFTWTLAVVEGCPHRLTLGKLSFEPCVRFEAGALEGMGENILPARRDTRPWLGLGAVGRVEWLFLQPLFVEMEGGVRAPFVRTTYFFEPDTVLYRVPAVGGMLSASLGARFL